MSSVVNKKLIEKAYDLGFQRAIADTQGRSDFRRFTDKPEVEVVEAIDRNVKNWEIEISDTEIAEMLSELVDAYYDGYEIAYQVHSSRSTFR